MTEIEKMFKNAGIKKQYCGWLDMGDLDCQMQYVRCNSITEWKHAVFSSRFGESEEEPEHIYPPFTAEKQLKICEWFISNSWWLNLKSLDKKLDFSLDFEEKLAKLVNRLWESFDDQEKEEIRSILNE